MDRTIAVAIARRWNVRMSDPLNGLNPAVLVLPVWPASASTQRTRIELQARRNSGDRVPGDMIFRFPR
jgi:hypothetical protein